MTNPNQKPDNGNGDPKTTGRHGDPSFLSLQQWRRKGAPAVIVIAIDATVGGGSNHVAVMPITHAAPRDPSVVLELPRRLKDHLGLDGERSWVVLDEINEFDWPGYDLARVEGGAGEWEYGQIPPGFHNQIKARAIELEARNRLHIQLRDDDAENSLRGSLFSAPPAAGRTALGDPASSTSNAQKPEGDHNKS